jgi:hypothetical protein
MKNLKFEKTVKITGPRVRRFDQNFQSSSDQKIKIRKNSENFWIMWLIISILNPVSSKKSCLLFTTLFREKL